MRILHRYVSLLFLSATLLFLLSFTFLFVLVDFDTFSSAKITLALATKSTRTNRKVKLRSWSFPPSR